MLYKPTVTRKRADGTTYTVKTGRWWGRYNDPGTGKTVLVGLKTSDRSAAQLLLTQIEINAALAAVGKRDQYANQKARPLTEHIADWRAALEGKGRTPDYVELVTQRATAVCTARGFAVWADINAAAVWQYIGVLEGRGMKAKTRNGYLAAIHGLTLWLRDERRVPDDPLAGAKPLRVTDETEAGVFTPEEMRVLLAATEQARTRRGMAGGLRRLFYQLAVETGFRSGECRSIAWGDINLDAATPAATVTAGRAKNRRRYDQPLTAGLVRLLGAWRAQCEDTDPTARVFPTAPSRRHVAAMLRADMDAAGIPIEDAAGRARNFHSLRHTFATNLANSGVHPRHAMELLRHGSIDLTMKRYTHTFLPDRAVAIETLPDLGSPGEAAAGVA